MTRGRLWLVVLLSLSLAAHARVAEPVPMIKKNHAVVRLSDAVLELRMNYDASRDLVTAEYEVRNEGAQAIAIFDRGDSLALATRRQRAGENVLPMSDQDGARLTLSHLALALPNPAPTVPRISLAAKIDPGKSIAAAFEIDLPRDVREVRYCLGFAPFNADDFSAVDTQSSLPVWRTAFTVSAHQSELCSDWFVLVDGSPVKR